MKHWYALYVFLHSYGENKIKCDDQQKDTVHHYDYSHVVVV